MARFSQPVADAMASYGRARFDRYRWPFAIAATAFLAAATVLFASASWLGVVPLVVAVYAGTAAWLGFHAEADRRRSGGVRPLP